MLRIFEAQQESLVLAGSFVEGMAQRPRARWYDILNPTPEEDRYVERALGIQLPTREEMQEIELSARLYAEDGAEFLTITALANIDSGEPIKTPITFVLKEDSLVTLRYADLRPFAVTTARFVRSGQTAPSGELLMLNLLEALLNRMADVIEQASDEIDSISDDVFKARTTANPEVRGRNLEGLIERIGRKGQSLGLARESLVSIGRMIAYHQARLENPKKIDPEIRALSRIVQRDAQSLSENAGFLSTKISFLLDAVLGLINLQQNGIIKIFSVAAVVFLPPTMIASIYGMNFEHMPELSWLFGYPFALILMVLSAVGPYLYFKRRGWL